MDKINQTQSTVCNTEEINNDAILITNNYAALEIDGKNSENIVWVIIIIENNNNKLRITINCRTQVIMVTC